MSATSDPFRNSPKPLEKIMSLTFTWSLSLRCLTPSVPLCPQGHLSEGYGKLCSIYLKLLITKMEFHVKVSNAPACMTDRQTSLPSLSHIPFSRDIPHTDTLL